MNDNMIRHTRIQNIVSGVLGVVIGPAPSYGLNHVTLTWDGDPGWGAFVVSKHRIQVVQTPRIK